MSATIKTDYNDLKELRMSAEAFDWLEENMPEVREMILRKFTPEQVGRPTIGRPSIGSAIIVAEVLRHRRLG